MNRLIVLLPIAFVAVAAAAPSAEHPLPPIAKGVTIGGLKVGGLNAETARTRVRQVFERDLHFVFGQKRWTVSPAQIGASAEVGRSVTWALKARPRHHVSLPIHVAQERLNKYVSDLNGHLARPAKNSRLIGLSNLRPLITPARPGLKVDQKEMEARIMRALQPSRRAPIPFAARHVQPAITRANFGPVIVVETASHRLLFYQGPRLDHTFTVATGQAAYPTPSGQWTIVQMQLNPWWIPPPDAPWAQGAKPIPPGPGNPLGTRWMGLSAPGVGIHGTPDPASLGYSLSHGCIRMFIPDAEWVFNRVHVGTPVFTVAA
jgi:hypothetical protein